MKRRNFMKQTGRGLALSSVSGLTLASTRAASAQTGLISSATHGSSVTIEAPDGTEFIRHAGFGTIVGLRPETGCWIHAAVPTPFVMSESKPVVARVKVKFFTNNTDVVVSHIDVYDGELLVQSQKNLALSDGQDFAFEIDPPHPMSSGLGISLYVAAGKESLSHEIQLYSAGGTFLVTS
jgi:hypothetical protein